MEDYKDEAKGILNLDKETNKSSFLDEEKKEDEFEELMKKKQTDTTLINDEYFIPEEL